MRRAYPNQVHFARRSRRTPAWLQTAGWTFLFLALSVAVLAATAYSV